MLRRCLPSRYETVTASTTGVIPVWRKLSPVAGSRPRIARQQVPLATLFLAQAGVGAHRDRLELALQLLPGGVALAGQRAVGQGGADGTPGLRVVRAVVEAALRRQLLHVAERLFECICARLPQL